MNPAHARTLPLAGRAPITALNNVSRKHIYSSSCCLRCSRRPRGQRLAGFLHCQLHF